MLTVLKFYLFFMNGNCFGLADNMVILI